MKKFHFSAEKVYFGLLAAVGLVLILVLLLRPKGDGDQIFGTTVPTETQTPETPAPNTRPPETATPPETTAPPEDVEYGVAPYPFYPFISRGEEEYDSVKEMIGPNNCVAGYLYVKNRETGEIIQILDEPVESFGDRTKYMICVTKSGKIVRTDYTGSNCEVLYISENEKLTGIAFYNGDLYFIEGTAIRMLNLSTGTAATVMETEMENLVALLVYEDSFWVRDSRFYGYTIDRVTGAVKPDWENDN